MCPACTTQQNSAPRPELRILCTIPRLAVHYVGIIAALDKSRCIHAAPHPNEEGHPPIIMMPMRLSLLHFFLNDKSVAMSLENGSLK